MPPQLIVRPQIGSRKAEQFTPELKWQSRVLRLILQADLRVARQELRNLRTSARPSRTR